MLRILLLCIFLLNSSYMQLTTYQKKYIIEYVEKAQDIKSGLFKFGTGNILRENRMAVEILSMLKVNIHFSKEICSKIAKEKDGYDKTVIDSLLSCSYPEPKNVPYDTKYFVDLYNEIMMKKMLNQTDFSKELYVLKTYNKNGKFFLVKEGIKKTRSFLATALGLESLSVLYKSGVSDESIIEMAKECTRNIKEKEESLSDNIIVFRENNEPQYRLNYHIIKALKGAKSIGIDIRDYPNFLYKITKYYQVFKYSMFSNIDNLYYYLKSSELLAKIPLISINPSAYYDYIQKPNLEIKFSNIFGDDLLQKNGDIIVYLDRIRGLRGIRDDEDEDKKGSSKSKISAEVNGTNKIDVDIGNLIKLPGDYEIKIEYNNNQYKIKEIEKFNIRAFSEVVKENIELSLEIEDKIFEDKTIKAEKIKYPNKYTNVFKATQDHALRLLVTLPTVDSKNPSFSEQTFLRLTHKKLNKSYNAYSYNFSPDKSEYKIIFSLDDPVNMESYNGEYSLSMISASAGDKEPIEWEFGSIYITFTKPTDPNETDTPLMNPLLPDMEPTFPPEFDRNKHKLLGIIFSCIIIISSIILVYILIKLGCNISFLPKSGLASFYNCLFISILINLVVVFLLFWLKLNIVETLKIFVFLSLPSIFVAYKAMKSNKVDLNIDNKKNEGEI